MFACTLSATLLAATASMGAGQLGGLGGLGGGQLQLPGLDNIFKKGPAITTSLKDAKFEASDKDSFSPQSRNLLELQRTPNGGFVLQPGGWTASVQSY